MTERILVVGLDSADKSLIARWAGDGTLPNFQRLIENAASALIRNPLGLEGGSLWPSFHTGLLPGNHGQYDGYRRYDPLDYQDKNYGAGDLPEGTIWNLLSAAGKRVVVIDAPFADVSDGLNGVQIADWAPHSRPTVGDFGTFRTWPSNLAADMEARFGTDPLGQQMCDAIRPRSAPDLRSFRDSMIERIRKKAEMSAHFLEQEDWSFFFTVFTEPHCVGHHAWHIHDNRHPEHDPEVARALGDPLRDVYIALDHALGELIDRVDRETLVLVHCTHGIGPRFTGTFLLDKILVALQGGSVSGKERPLGQMAKQVWWRLPAGLRNRMQPMQARLWKAMGKSGFQPDRATRTSFELIVNDGAAGVRVNLAGREGQGIVQPGAEYDALLNGLSESLLAITNETTGKPLVKRVIKTDEMHDGARRDALPDLIVIWNRSGPIGKVTSPEFGTIEHAARGHRTGDHTPLGLLYAFGPGLTGGATLDEISVADLAPTITRLLGVEHPGADGRPIPALIDAAMASEATAP